MKRPFYQLNQSKDVIRHFTPNWFTATMGTGVVSMILIQLPFAKSFLFMLATLLWQFNIVLFSVFQVFIYCDGFFSLMKRSKYLIIQI